MRNYRKSVVAIGLLMLLLCGGCGNKKSTEEVQKDNSKVTQQAEATTETKPEEVLEDMSDIQLNTLIPTESNVKMLGRTYTYNDTIWCALSATGIEFEVTGTRCDLTFVGDNMAKATEELHNARIGIYVDGKLAVDDFIREASQTFTAFESEEEKTVTIRAIKLSESSDSTVGISQILTDATEVVATKEKEVKIEFIGDSITCGYGVEGTLDDVYSTATENASKAFAYICAKAMNADYSLVSYSGYGILSGYTGDGTINTTSVLPPYYTKVGNSYGKFASSVAPDSIDWDFSKFVPNVVVINLGTNDASYCGSDKERCLEFQKSYVEFIKTVRENNADALILCTLGIMGSDLYPYIEAAVNDYTNETGDLKIQALQLEQQNSADGYGVDYHPNAVSQQKAADKLKVMINVAKRDAQLREKQFASKELDTSWIDPEKKLVAFAFDDGPVSWSENSTAMRILKALEAKGQHGTFFYIGQNINSMNQKEIEYAQSIGCEVANHTWTHPYLTKLSEDEIKDEVEKTRAKLEEITGISNYLLRLPFLNYDVKVLDVLADMKVPGVSCSVDSQDWNNGTYDSVLSRMLAAEENGSLDGAIILMHENYSFTADAVEYLVPYLLDKGYQIVSVSELAAVRGVTLEGGKVYTNIN